MDRRELNRMFDQLNPDPEREGELLEELLQDGARRKRPMKNWKKVAIGLAAMMVLAGTAAAARFTGVSIVDRREDDGFVNFSGGMSYYSVNELSDDLKSFEAAYTGEGGPMKAFESWEAMEDFIGVDLMNNPLLDASPAQHYRKSVDDGEQKVWGRFILVVYRGLPLLIAHGCYEIGDTNINVEAYLFTDALGERESGNEEFYGLGLPEGTRVDWEACTTSGGRQAQVMEIDRTDGHRDTCLGAVTLNGIPVLVRVHSNEGVAEARQTLMQVLDSFQ